MAFADAVHRRGLERSDRRVEKKTSGQLALEGKGRLDSSLCACLPPQLSVYPNVICRCTDRCYRVFVLMVRALLCLPLAQLQNNVTFPASPEDGVSESIVTPLGVQGSGNSRGDLL